MNLRHFTLDLGRAVQFWHCFVPGEPQPKERARRGRGGRWYTPKNTERAERDLAWQVRAAFPSLRVNGLALFGLRCIFYCAAKNPPDKDNLTKLVQDALAGLVWVNDRQVREGYELVLPASAFQSASFKAPGTEILFYELDPKTAKEGR